MPRILEVCPKCGRKGVHRPTTYTTLDIGEKICKYCCHVVTQQSCLIMVAKKMGVDLTDATAAELADRLNLPPLTLAQLLQARKYLQLRIDEFDEEIKRRPMQ